MKKVIKGSLIAALSISVLTPVMSVEAEKNIEAVGFYNIDTGDFISQEKFLLMTLKKKVEILKKPSYYFVLDNGQAISSRDILVAKSDEILETLIRDVEEIEREIGIIFPTQSSLEAFNNKIEIELGKINTNLMEVEFDRSNNIANIKILDKKKKLIDISGTGLLTGFFTLDDVYEIKMSKDDQLFTIRHEDGTQKNLIVVKLEVGSMMAEELGLQLGSATLEETIGKQMSVRLTAKTPEGKKYYMNYIFNFVEG